MIAIFIIFDKIVRWGKFMFNDYILEFKRRKKIFTIWAVIIVILLIIDGTIFLLSVFEVINQKFFLIPLIILMILSAIYFALIVFYANCPKCGKFHVGFFSSSYCPYCAQPFKLTDNEKKI